MLFLLNYKACVMVTDRTIQSHQGQDGTFTGQVVSGGQNPSD